MKESHITRNIGRPRKTIRETDKKNLKINELEKNMIFDITLCRCLIHLTDFI